VLTIALTALTGIVSVAGLISPAVLGALERTPAALHGEAWRGVALDHVAAGRARRSRSGSVRSWQPGGRPCSRWVSSAPCSTAP
jgi:hypothetical protein